MGIKIVNVEEVDEAMLKKIIEKDKFVSEDEFLESIKEDTNYIKDEEKEK